MAKRQFKLSEQEEKDLQRAFLNETDGATRIRFQAVRLYGQGYAVPEICQITGSNRSSLMEWCAKYRERGVDGLPDHRGGPRRSKLTIKQVEEVADKLRQYTPYQLFGPEAHTSSGQHWTVPDLVRAIAQWYGVTWRSLSSYRTLFQQCGFSYQRTEKVYKSRREPNVMDFEEQVEKN
jgi:transposase